MAVGLSLCPCSCLTACLGLLQQWGFVVVEFEPHLIGNADLTLGLISFFGFCGFQILPCLCTSFCSFSLVANVLIYL